MGWSPVEVLALAETAPLVLQDPATGCGQTAAALSRRIRSCFLARAPPAAGSKLDSWCDLDPRRWAGRTSRACKERWDTIKAACIIYKLAVDFVEGANMTGNRTAAEKARCYLACYNAHVDKSGMGSRSKHLTTISRDAFYPIGPPFEYLPCYRVLIKNTDLLLTTGVDAGSGVDGGLTPGDVGAVGVTHESSPQGGLGEDDGVPPRDGSDTRAAAVLGVGEVRDKAGGGDVEGLAAGSSSLPADVVASGPRTERPKGNKAAKRSKALKRKAEIE